MFLHTIKMKLSSHFSLKGKKILSLVNLFEKIMVLEIFVLKSLNARY